jgi:hypothetical protein
MDTGAASSDIGVESDDSWFFLFNTNIEKFGGRLVSCDVDCSAFTIQHNLFSSGYADHLYVNASNTTGIIANNVSQQGAGIGYHVVVGANLQLISNFVEGMTGNAFDISGNSNKLQGNYCEGSGAGVAMVLRGVYLYVENPQSGGCAITNPGGPSNTVWDASQGNPSFAPLTLGPSYGAGGLPSSPTYYTMRSGAFGTAAFDLSDVTNSANIYTYTPAANQGTTHVNTFDMLQYLRLAKPIIQISGTLPVFWKQDSTGSGTQSAGVAFHGNNSSAAEAVYGAVAAAIDDNTAAAQKGSLHLYYVTGAALVDGAQLDKTGKFIMKPPTSCSGLATGTLWNNSGTLAICP